MTQPATAPEIIIIPKAKKPPKMPIWVPMTLVTIALVSLTVVFLTGQDAASGLGQAGWVSAVIAGACVLGFLITLVRKRTFLGFNGLAYLILAVFFVAIGAAGILSETPVHTLQADAFKKEGNFEQAIVEYRKGIENNRSLNIADSYLLWGNGLLKDKQFEKAIVAYRAGSAPEYKGIRQGDLARKSIGQAYLEWGLYLEDFEQNPDQALIKYDDTVKDGSNSEAIDKARYQAQGIIFQVGDRQFDNGEFDKAVATYQSAIDLYGGVQADLKPYISKAYLAWGKMLLTQGDYEQALKKLDLNFAYGNDVGAYNLAIVDCYTANGKKLLAENNYSDLIATLTPAFTAYGRYDSRSQLQGLLGEALMAQGSSAEAAKDYPKAIDNYEKALTYVVNKVDVTSDLKLRLSNLHLQYGDDQFNQQQFETAIKTYQRSLQYYPNPPLTAQFRTNLARSYFNWAQQLEKNNDFQNALDRYRLILKDYSDQVDFTKQASDAQPRVLLALANKLNDDKDYANAITRYQELVDKFGITSQGQDAKNKLEASQDVTVTVLDRNGKPLSGLKVKLDESWTKTANGFEPKGRSLDFTTNDKGSFTIKLVPNKSWMMSYYKNGSYSVAAYGDSPANLVKSVSLRATSSSQSVLLP
ncbi:MAG: tetratricopeptide repeat protein [Chloroflexi bacterium]|uniref:Tetratricopeptide repeat protein n=1 Tax=Candidatus Chlorohelix allophototropha TaxID=3003348 RepID=A0A8T7M1C6_9CHLR|nr:tetratricopeptide repeat protein [Chloroflexota bacterium]WJW67713.1 tetratricopeptide repeat protein [Chloroflexota bacterium L227-S17]